MTTKAALVMASRVLFRRSANCSLILCLSLAGGFASAEPSVPPATSSGVFVASPTVATSFIVEKSTATPRTWRKAPNKAFREQEDLQFVVKWGVITAGYSSLKVTGLETIDGRPAYHLDSEAHSGGVVNTFYTVNDRNEAWLDRDSLTSVRYTKTLREGSFKEDDTIKLDQVHGRWHRLTERLDKKKSEEKEGDLPPDALDVQSSLYYVRTLPLAVGASFTMDVHSGDKIYPLVVTVRKRQKIKVPAGTFDTFLVQPLLRGPGMFVSKGKKLEVWMTTDERHMPVRMRSEVFFGHVSAELIKTQ
jgi:hypothetical protein